MGALDVSDMMSEGRESIMSSAGFLTAHQIVSYTHSTDYGRARIRRTLFAYISTILLLLVLGTRYPLVTLHNFVLHY